MTQLDDLYQMIAVATDDCITWPYKQNDHGYGRVSVSRTNRLAHVVACASMHGERPTPRHQAAHSCGQSLCINPLHLRWATPRENNADKHLHGTQPKGSAVAGAKLTADEVQQIRLLAPTTRGAELARRFGVSPAQICQILSRKSWAWLPDLAA